MALCCTLLFPAAWKSGQIATKHQNGFNRFDFLNTMTIGWIKVLSWTCTLLLCGLFFFFFLSHINSQKMSGGSEQLYSEPNQHNSCI